MAGAQTSTSIDRLSQVKASQRVRFTEWTSSSAGSPGAGSIQALRPPEGAINNSSPSSLQEQLTEAQVINAQLEGANAHLRRRLQDALLQLDSIGNSQSVSDANDSPQSRDPVTQLASERARQERRNAKALALLRSKDEHIASLEAECASISDELAKAKMQYRGAAQQLEESQIRIDDLIEVNTTLKKELANSVVVSLPAPTALATQAVASIQGATVALEAPMASEQHIGTLGAALQAADEFIENMEEGERALYLKYTEERKQNEHLRRLVHRLLGVAVEQAFDGQALEVNDKAHDASHENEKLKLEINNLERALVYANLRLAGIDSSVHSTPQALLTELSHAVGSSDVHHPKESNSIIDLIDDLMSAKVKSEQLVLDLNVARQEAENAQAELQVVASKEATSELEQQLIVAEDRVLQLTVQMEGLRNELEQAKDGAASEREQNEELSTRCNALAAEIVAAMKNAQEMEKKAYSATLEATRATEEASRMRTCVLQLQAHNDELREAILDLEKSIAFHETQSTAHEAQEAALSRWRRGAGVSSSTALPPTQELARNLEEAAHTQIELHRQISCANKVKNANERALERMRGSMDLLKSAIRGDADDEEPRVDVYHNESFDRITESAEKTIRSLRDQIVHAVAMQQGQAAAFAVLSEEASQRVATVLDRAQEADKMENACVAAVAALHAALAQAAAASGDEGTAEALLQADVRAADLESVVKAVTTKLQDLMLAHTQQSGNVDEQDTRQLKAHTAAAVEKVPNWHIVENGMAQVEGMAQRLVLLTDRISLLTASNEAAQEEAEHGRGAIAELAAALREAHAAHEHATKQAATREERLQSQLHEAQEECKQLLEVVDHLERDQSAWERKLQTKIATLQASIDNICEKDTSTRSGELPSRLPALLDGLDVLLREAAVMENRLGTLEAAAAEAATWHAQARWSCLAKGLVRVRELAAACKCAQGENDELKEVCSQQGDVIDQLRDEIRRVQHERAASIKRLEAVRAAHEDQMQRMSDMHAEDMKAAEDAAQDHLVDLERRIEAATLAAAAAGENKARLDISSGIQSAKVALRELEQTCASLRAERDAIHAEFMKYRSIKSAEIVLLEQRLGIALPSEDGDGMEKAMHAHDAEESLSSSSHSNQGQRGAELRMAAAVGEISAACRADAIAAALREAKLERAHRLEIQEALAEAKRFGKTAAAATKAAEGEAGILRQRLRDATTVSELKTKELTALIDQTRAEVVDARALGLAGLAAAEEARDQVVEVACIAAESERLQKEGAEREIRNAHAALAEQSASVQELLESVVRVEQKALRIDPGEIEFDYFE